MLADTDESSALALFEGVPSELELNAGEEAWFEFEVPTQAFYTLTATGGQLDPVMHLYDSAMNEVEVDDDDGPDSNSRIERQLTAGTWALRLRLLGDAVGSLDVLAERQSEGVPDGSTITRAVPLQVGAGSGGGPPPRPPPAPPPPRRRPRGP